MRRMTRAQLVTRTLVAFLLAASLGCATMTRFHTRPEGATIYVNGSLLGETPALYNDERDMPKRYHIEIYKDGYEPLDFYLDTEMSWIFGYLGYFPYTAPIAGPFLLLIGWRANKQYTFNLMRTAAMTDTVMPSTERPRPSLPPRAAPARIEHVPPPEHPTPTPLPDPPPDNSPDISNNIMNDVPVPKEAEQLDR